MTSMFRQSVLGALAALTVVAAPAGAQDSPFVEHLQDHLKLSVSDRARWESVSYFDPHSGPTNNQYDFYANRLRAGMTLSYETVEFVVEGQDTRLVNLPGADSINPAVGGPMGPGAAYYRNTADRDQGETFIRRGYATIRNFGIPGVSGRFGRFGYNTGLEKPAKEPALAWLQKARLSQRLIGEFEYTHVGRSFDGAMAMYDQGPFNVTAMVGHPTSGGFNVNANYDLKDIDVVSAAVSLVEPGFDKQLSLQGFYLYYADNRDPLRDPTSPMVLDNRPKTGECREGASTDKSRNCDDGNIQISTFGGNVAKLVDAGPGKIDLVGWLAIQAGDWQSQDHIGWAYAVETGYQLPSVATKPWLRVGFFRSSGDDDPSDSHHHTFFQMLPTARQYAMTPFYNLMNNQDLFVQAILKPVQNVTVAATGHWLRTTESADLWYAGGGATSDTVFGYTGINTQHHRGLAYLVDFDFSYKATDYLTLGGYYGHMFGQGGPQAVFHCPDADFGFIELTLAYDKAWKN